MNWLWSASEFVRRIRSQLRFGERSRLPLRLRRLEVRENVVECEWFARANDPWDEGLRAEVRERNETFQALRDALSVREALFESFPEIRCASVRVYREREAMLPQLVISGTVSREDEIPPRISSLVMRAKLSGLRFNLSEGTFESLGPEAGGLQLVNQ